MGPVLSRPGLRAGFAGLAVAGAALVLSACSAQPKADDANLISGKQLFVQKCGSCHVLARAGTKGTTGPNLDEAFQQAIKDGMPRSDFAGAIHGQILHPNRNGVMPAKLVTGDQAYDIAAYVAQSVAAGGKDTGLLATAVKQAGGGKPAVEKNGNAPDRRRPDRPARLRDRRGDGHARADHGQDAEQVRHAARHRHRRQGQGRDRPERRRLAVPGRLHGRELHVLLLGARATARPECRASSRSSSAGAATHPAVVLKLPLVPSE